MDKPHNVGAVLFFFPGYGVTMKNVEEAIIAAKERAQHRYFFGLAKSQNN